MIISVSTLANAINEKRNIKPEEIAADNGIIKIIVELSSNGKQISYYVDTKAGRETYNENTVPASIISLMNRNSISYREVWKDNTEIMVYSFNR